LSHFVPVTLTNTKNGSAVLSTPAVVTILSTSSGSSGDIVTYSHVFANPPSSISGNKAFASSGYDSPPPRRGIRELMHHRLLGNRGAIAALFVVVGVVAATVALCIVFFFRRRRRLNRPRRWLAGMHQQSYNDPSNPFEDPGNPPEMRAVSDDQSQRVRESIDRVALNDIIPGPYPTNRRHSDLKSIGAGSRTDFQEHDRSSNDVSNHQIGPTLTANLDYKPIEPSIAQSSLSIYPPSLPSIGDDDPYEVKDRRLEVVSPIQYANIVADVPPRPPRSLLRRNSKPLDIFPPTPPSSASSHSSPIVDQFQFNGSLGDILNRRTLLDVRYSHLRCTEFTLTFLRSLKIRPREIGSKQSLILYSQSVVKKEEWHNDLEK
jgi:hypothetical protein